MVVQLILGLVQSGQVDRRVELLWMVGCGVCLDDECKTILEIDDVASSGVLLCSNEGRPGDVGIKVEVLRALRRLLKVPCLVVCVGEHVARYFCGRW